MRIIELRASNVKRIKAVTIRPDGDLVEITGKNGAGKSSVLDAIWFALAGTRSHQSQPVRQGAKEAEIRLDLGDLVVERDFKVRDDERVTTSLRVSAPDGAIYGKPQSMLDGLLGPLTFDPLQFARADAPDRLKLLCSAAGIDLDEFEGQNRRDREERRVANRKSKDARAAANAIDAPDDEPAQPAAVQDLIERRRQLEKSNLDLAAERERHERAVEQSQRMQEEGAALLRQADDVIAVAEKQAADILASARDRAARLKEQGQARQDEGVGLAKRLKGRDPFPEPADLSEIDAEVLQRDEAQETWAAWKRRRELIDQAVAAAEEAGRFDESLRKRQADLTAQVQTVMPINGLQLDDGDLLVDGFGFDVLNDALRLEISCAVAMAQEPKLRVMRIRDGSLLDSDSMKVLAKLAKEKDYQVWIERVDESGQVGVVIEDGEVAAVAKSGGEQQGGLL